MSLQNELDNFQSAWIARVGPEIAALVDGDNASLATLAAASLGAGARFPAAVLRDQLDRPVDLRALAAQRPLVITFYRGLWCPYCNLELRAYQQALTEIVGLGAGLVAISPERPDNTLSMIEKNDLAFPVLSDPHGNLADALGIRFPLSPAIIALYQKFGHDLPAHNATDSWSLPMPATYVVDRDGIIVHAIVNPDYRQRMDPADAIKVLRALARPRAA